MQKKSQGGDGDALALDALHQQQQQQQHHHHPEVIQVGSTVKVLVDYRAVKEDEVNVSRGQMVSVLDTDSLRGGYLVRKVAAVAAAATDKKAEGWVPNYVLNLLTTAGTVPGGGGGAASLGSINSGAPPKKPAWAFKKFRKPSFSSKKELPILSVGEAAAQSSGSAASGSGHQNLAPVHALAGETARMSFTVPVQLASTELCPVWRVGGGDVLLPGGQKYGVTLAGPLPVHPGSSPRGCSLQVNHCQASDSGDYTCSLLSAATEEVLFTCHASLAVMGMSNNSIHTLIPLNYIDRDIYYLHHLHHMYA